MARPSFEIGPVRVRPGRRQSLSLPITRLIWRVEINHARYCAVTTRVFILFQCFCPTPIHFPLWRIVSYSLRLKAGVICPLMLGAPTLRIPSHISRLRV